MRKGSFEVWCIAQGEDAFKGLSWISTDKIKYSATGKQFYLCVASLIQKVSDSFKSSNLILFPDLRILLATVPTINLSVMQGDLN